MTVWDFVFGVLFGIIVCCRVFAFYRSLLCRSGFTFTEYTGDVWRLGHFSGAESGHMLGRYRNRRLSCVYKVKYLFLPTAISSTGNTPYSESFRHVYSRWRNHPFSHRRPSLAAAPCSIPRSGPLTGRGDRYVFCRSVCAYIKIAPCQIRDAVGLRSTRRFGTLWGLSTFNDTIEYWVVTFMKLKNWDVVVGTENEYLHSWFSFHKIETRYWWVSFLIVL